MRKLTDSQFHKSVFRRVLAQYDEVRAVQGSSSCAKSFSFDGSNFVCDVELAARRALTAEGEFYFWKTVYVEKNDAFIKEYLDTLSGTRASELRHSVQEKIGKMLVSRRIHPVKNYFKR